MIMFTGWLAVSVSSSSSRRRRRLVSRDRISWWKGYKQAKKKVLFLLPHLFKNSSGNRRAKPEQESKSKGVALNKFAFLNWNWFFAVVASRLEWIHAGAWTLFVCLFYGESRTCIFYFVCLYVFFGWPFWLGQATRAECILENALLRVFWVRISFVSQLSAASLL